MKAPASFRRTLPTNEAMSRSGSAAFHGGAAPVGSRSASGLPDARAAVEGGATGYRATLPWDEETENRKFGTDFG